MTVQVEQTGSWGPFPLLVSQRGRGGQDLETVRGWAGEVGVGEEQGRSCPTAGNNRGAAFRLGSEGGGLLLAGKEGRRSQGALLLIPPHPLVVLGAGGGVAGRS